MESTEKKYIAIKVLLALLPAIVFTQNYAWMTLNTRLGVSFLIIWILMIWSVWQFSEKNHIFERLFRLTEVAFFLLPISAISFSFLIGSRAVSSVASEVGKAGAAIGMAIGGTVAVVLAFIIGIIGGIIMHLIAGKYDKKAELSEIKQTESIANRHGIILSLIGVIVLVIVVNQKFSGVENKNIVDQPVTDVAKTTQTVATNETPQKTEDADSGNEKTKQLQEKVGLEITKKTFFKGDFKDQIQMDLKFTNKTDKNIKGVQGVVTFYGIFDNEITSSKISYDQGISVGQSKIWKSGMDYNRFIDRDVKLKDTELKDLRYEWKVNMIVYENGDKESL